MLDGWQRATLEEIAYTVSVRGHQAQTNEYDDTGTWPIIDQGQALIVGYTDAYEPIREPLPIVLFGDHTRLVKFIEEPFVVGADGTKLLTPKPEKADPRYLLVLVEVAARQIPSLGYSRHFKELKEVVLPLPPLSEQRKIAEILRTWDEALEKLTALRMAKELKYRAFARKFFEPCHLSFHGRPNIWQEFELDAIFTERSQAGVDGERLLSVTMNGGVIDRDDVGRKDTSTDDKSRYKLVLPGDIAYNTMRMWQGVSGLSTIQGIVSPAYTVVTPLEARILGRYAAHLFKSRRMVFDFERYSQGLTSDTWNLKFPAFSKIKVWLPPVDDQEKQADLLDAMLCELDVLRQQTEALTRQKRGLMQKLLTGEWRVTGDASVTEPAE